MSNSMSAQRPTPLRALGFLEHFRVVVHDLGFHYNVALAARYSYQFPNTTPIQQLVFAAFAHAVQVHPALGIVVLQRDTAEPCFARLEAVDLRALIRVETWSVEESDRTKKMERFLAEENSRGFEISQLPLWRAIVLLDEEENEQHQSFSIAFIWHHVIGDGRSGFAVHATLLDAFRSYAQDSHGASVCSAGTGDHHWAPTSQSPLQAPLEELLSLTTSALDICAGAKEPPIKALLSEVSAAEKWSGSSFNYDTPIQTDIRCMRIPAASLQQLVTNCRLQHTTVTALLQALIGEALFSLTGANRVRAACAISLRRFFAAPRAIDDSVMGLWISAFCTDYDRSDFPGGPGRSDVWSQARENSRRVQHEVAKGDMDIDIGALRHIADFKTWLLAKEGHARENSFGLTNLGVFTQTTGDERNEGWQVRHMVFSQSCHANGSAVQICVVSVAGGDMNVAFSWQRGVVTSEFVEELSGFVRKSLMELGSPIDVN